MPSPTLVAISCGDPNGIGLEVALRAFADERMFAYFTPVVFASPGLVAAHAAANDLVDVPVRPLDLDDLPPTRPLRARPTDPDPEPQPENGEPEDGEPRTPHPTPRTQPKLARAVHVVDCFAGEEPEFAFGVESAAAGAVAKTSLEHAAHALAEGRVACLVTAPIHKSAMQQAGFGYPGHTEFLEAEFAVDRGRSLMLMVGEEGLRVAVATNHVPLRSVASSISPTILKNKIGLLLRSLERDFGLVGPRVAVLGLNPHAGDGGAIGTEEESTIRPAVEDAKSHGIDIMGPFPADGFFGSGRYRDFDGVLAMYHDQGLVPFKTLAFGGGVNFTAGLTVVRASPDHGTALDIAGQGRADASSFTEALFLARDAVRARAEFDEDHANPVRKRKKRRDFDRGGRGGRDRDRNRSLERGKKGGKGGGAKSRRRDPTGDEKRAPPRKPAVEPAEHRDKSPAEGLAEGTGAPTKPAREIDPAKAANVTKVVPPGAPDPSGSSEP